MGAGVVGLRAPRNVTYVKERSQSGPKLSCLFLCASASAFRIRVMRVAWMEVSCGARYQVETCREKYEVLSEWYQRLLSTVLRVLLLSLSDIRTTWTANGPI